MLETPTCHGCPRCTEFRLQKKVIEIIDGECIGIHKQDLVILLELPDLEL